MNKLIQESISNIHPTERESYLSVHMQITLNTSAFLERLIKYAEFKNDLSLGKMIEDEIKSQLIILKGIENV